MRLLRKVPRLYEESALGTQHRDGSGPKWEESYLHGPCFASTSLSIGEDSPVKTSNDGADDRYGDFLVDFDLVGARSEYLIKSETVFIVVADLDESRGTLMVIYLEV